MNWESTKFIDMIHEHARVSAETKLQNLSQVGALYQRILPAYYRHKTSAMLRWASW